ncbi:MAG TPA: hypothetical protein VMG12_44695 [Polyangiaceae bacterium]|nr:hypothetical protein [Polyangiaceae bacterium]
MAPLPPEHPVPTSEGAALRAALRGSFSEIVGFLIPRVDAPARLEAELLAALAEDEALAAGVGKALLALPAAARQRILPVMARDPRPSVRRALFHEWAPEVLEVPRPLSALLPVAEWRELLKAALGDDDGGVRVAAAALAFDSGHASALAAELMRVLDADTAPDRELAWRAVLGLGQASDEASLERLRAIAASDDGALAAAAVRALAARSDGRATWRAAFSDARAEVRGAALFALARVVERLEPEQLADVEQAALAHEPPHVVAQALQAYRQRHVDAP